MTTPTWDDLLTAPIVSMESEAEQLAGAFTAKPDLAAIVRAETGSAVLQQHNALSRWHWFKRWRLRGILKVLAREEAAYRG